MEGNSEMKARYDNETNQVVLTLSAHEAQKLREALTADSFSMYTDDLLGELTKLRASLGSYGKALLRHGHCMGTRRSFSL